MDNNTSNQNNNFTNQNNSGADMSVDTGAGNTYNSTDLNSAKQALRAKLNAAPGPNVNSYSDQKPPAVENNPNTQNQSAQPVQAIKPISNENFVRNSANIKQEENPGMSHDIKTTSNFYSPDENSNTNKDFIRPVIRSRSNQTPEESVPNEPPPLKQFNKPTATESQVLDDQSQRGSVTPPQMVNASGDMATIEDKKGHKVLWTIFVIIILLISGGVGYAYWQHIGPFERPPYSKEDFLSGMVTQSLSETKNARTSFSFNVSKEKKDTDAVSFELSEEYKNSHEIVDIKALKRDQERIINLSSIGSGVYAFSDVKGRYPNAFIKTEEEGFYDFDEEDWKYTTTEEELDGITYSPSEDNKSFEIIVDFETKEATEAVIESFDYDEDNTVIENNSFTFKNYFPNFIFLNVYEYTSPGTLQEVLAYQGDWESILSLDNINVFVEALMFTEPELAGEFALKGSGTFSDITASVDVEFKTVDGVEYVKVNKFPAILFNIDSIRNKWISLEDADFSFAKDVAMVEGFDQDLTNKTEDDLYKMLEIFEEQEFIVLSEDPERVSRDGKTLYQYNIGIDAESYAQLYKRLSEEFEGEGGFATFDEEMYESFKDPEFIRAMEYLDDNSDISVLVNSGGEIVEMAFNFRWILPEESEYQMNVDMKMVIDRVKEDYKVVAPEDYISFSEAEEMISSLFMGGF